MYCKIERGDRSAKREQVIRLAELFHVNPKELLALWLADKVVETIKGEYELVEEVLEIVKQKIKK